MAGSYRTIPSLILVLCGESTSRSNMPAHAGCAEAPQQLTVQALSTIKRSTIFRTSGATTITAGNATAHELNQAATHLAVKPSIKPTAFKVVTPYTSNDNRPNNTRQTVGDQSARGA
jgi:hypothetical protein